MIRIVLFYAVSVLFLNLNAFAAPVTLKMDLKEVVRKGLEFSPEVQQAVSQMAESEAGTKFRRGYLYPQIDLYGSATWKEDPVRTTSAFRAKEDYDAGVRLVQPLYRGGILSGGIGTAQMNEEIDRAKLFSTKQNAVAALVSGYYDLVQKEKELIAAEEQLVVLKNYSSIINRYEVNGRARRMDRLQADVNVSLTAADQTRLMREKTVASDSLKKLMGLPPGGQELSGQVDLRGVQPRPVVNVDFDAIKDNPDLRAAESLRRRVEYENQVDLAADKPVLNLQAAYGFRGFERPEWFKDDSKYHNVALVLTVPLFSGFSSLAKRRVHTERLTQEDRAVDIAKLDLRQRLQAAILNEQNSWSRLEVAQAATKQGAQALQLANGAFGTGVASTQDVLSAQRTRYDAEKLLIESQFSFLRARTEVDRLRGADLETLFTR